MIEIDTTSMLVPLTISTVGLWIMCIGIWIRYSQSTENMKLPEIVLFLVAIGATVMLILFYIKAWFP
jgi:hypothetical protein